MTPESRVILVPVAATVVCAGLVLLAMGLCDLQPWAWWTLGALVALAVAVAYCWGWTVRQRSFRAWRRLGNEFNADYIRALPWWRVVLWGVKGGER